MANDLDAFLASLGDLGKLSPEELAEILGPLGIHVKRDEATGLKLVTLAQGDVPPAPAPVSLEPMLEHMNAEQLKQVAKRFNPEANATRMADCKRAIAAALKAPTLLDGMIAKLDPLERALLQEVKRQGGAVDGWELIVQVALQGFKPQTQISGSIYRHHQLSVASGARFLASSLRDGLLIPASNHASWFVRSYYYGDDADSSGPDDLLLADPRILDRLPDEPRPQPRPLELARLEGATPTANHPLQVLLELFDLMQLVAEEGGLQVTQNGTVGKPLLSRLAKRRPQLEGRLERLLQLGVTLGFVEEAESSSTKVPRKVRLPLLRKMQETPLALSYSLVVEAFLRATDQVADDPWAMRRSGLVSPEVAKRALQESLSILPGHPVAMQAALEGLWTRALKHIVKPRAHYWTDDEDEPERPAWFTGALTGAFRELGLVAVAERPDAQAPEQAPSSTLHVMRGGKITRYQQPSEEDTAYRYALMPAAGLSWLAEGQQLQGAKQVPGTRELRELSGLDPETGKPKEPSLLIQPNFDILVYLDKLSPRAIPALSCADCSRIDAQTASYTINRASLYRALETGLGLEELLHLLQEHSLGLPDNVARSLRDWAARRERLRFIEGVSLLEYSSVQERDAALKDLRHARALAGRFILLEDKVPLPRVKVRHQYSLAPTRTLRFHPEGRFRLEGATDLAGRAVLAQLATQDSAGSYHLNTEAIRAGALTTAARDALLARAHGGIPAQIEALLSIWEGKSPEPTTARISVFQHPSAAALAKHPRVAMHLGQPLNPTTYLIREGQEAKLEEVLRTLGVSPAEGFRTDIKAETVQDGIMQTGLDTRKMRVIVESAIGEGRSLELRYHEEKESYTRYGYSKISKGKSVTEKIRPVAIFYSGSTPYFSGKTLEGNHERRIRIGYITGLAVL